MTQPGTSSQVRYPWRAVLRTVVAAVISALPLLPEIAAGLHLGSVGTVVQFLAITGAITRLLANPAVEAWLHQYLPWLAAQPAPPLFSLPPPVAAPQPGDKKLWD